MKHERGYVVVELEREHDTIGRVVHYDFTSVPELNYHDKHILFRRPFNPTIIEEDELFHLTIHISDVIEIIE